ncbi:hypothetical protein GTP46_14130 [Duganella sp. FT135W]|uniref:Uncharacterized protein n=1 Tax=Duganella flavida TaxID=2692175 RepID=A0A6L8KC25_9BURK|nr:hypothetical protein [Duganella flavida]MYM23788.1 hypothetical protein [Duganella flavida]
MNILPNVPVSTPRIGKFSLSEGAGPGGAGARPLTARQDASSVTQAPILLGNAATIVLKASQTQLSRQQSVHEIAHVIKQIQDASPSDDATLVELTAQLNGMVGALSNLGDAAPAAGPGEDSLSNALESVSKAQAAIDASADSYYQSSLDEKASTLASAMTETLLEDINTASGSFDFSIEQTLLQADGNSLRDSPAISALVTYLLQQ